MTSRVGSWVELASGVWEHEPSGTKLRRDEQGGWSVRFPSTTAVQFGSDDAISMLRVMGVNRALLMESGVVQITAPVGSLVVTPRRWASLTPDVQRAVLDAIYDRQAA